MNIITKNVKIFDKNNPNFTIINTDEEIIDLFKEKSIPVVLDDLPLKIHLDNIKIEKVIGIVKSVNGFVNNELFGDVYLWEKEDSNKIFSNYEVTVDNNLKILSIIAIQFK